MWTSRVSAGLCGVLATGTVLKTAENDKKSRKRQIVLEGYQLKQVQVFVRHGARTPIHTIRNVPEVVYDKELFMGAVGHTYYNHNITTLSGEARPVSRYDKYYKDKVPILKGGCTRGQLTKLGQEQMYMKGRSLRKQYIEEAGFIDKIYNPDEVYIRSTNIERTLQTARCVAAGMYGAVNLNKLKEPLVIHVGEGATDVLVPQTTHCHVLRQINHMAMIHAGDLPDMKDDRLAIEEAIGIFEDDTDPHKHKLNFIDLRDDLVARETHGMGDVPQLRHMRNTIEKHASAVMYYAFCGTHEAERELAMQLSTGCLLNMLLGTMESTETNKTKLYIYSCHDSTLVGVLGSLGIYDFTWPPFGSDVRFELYENGEGHKFVRVSYQGQDVTVKGCSSKICALEEFKSALESVTLEREKFKEICASDILETIAKEMMEAEKGEIEDEEATERSDTPAGM